MRKTLDYTLLAGLAQEPQSGYDLTKWLATVASHFWPVGHSSVYPALAALEAAGLVWHEATPSEQGPERKVYSLTLDGRAELLAWTDSPPGAAQVRDEQLVRALCYGYLAPEHARARLMAVRREHEERLRHYEALERQIGGERRAGQPEDRATLGKRLVVRRGILNEEGYIRWCDEAIAILAAADTPEAGASATRR